MVRIHKPEPRNFHWWPGMVAVIVASLLAMLLLPWSDGGRWIQLTTYPILVLVFAIWWSLAWLTLPKKRDVDAMGSDPEYAEYQRLRAKFINYQIPKENQEQ